MQYHKGKDETSGADRHSALTHSVINLIDHRMNHILKTAALQRVPTDPGEVFLTIIMPAYNEEKTIRRAVRHVLSASYPCHVELIVVDDGSTDHTAALLSELSCDKLRIVRYRRNLGKGAALLTGIRLARGTHMLPFDADLEYSASDIARMLQPVLDGFVVDLAQRKAVDRVRLRYVGTDLNGGGIVGLLRRHGGEAT